MSRAREIRAQKEFVGEIKENGTPLAIFLVKSFYFLGYAFLPFCIVAGIIVAIIAKRIFWVFIGASFGFGIITVVAIVYIFLFLFAFSTGGLLKEDKPEATADKTRLAETQVNIDLAYTAHHRAKQRPKSAKAFAGLFYGFIFLCVIAIISGGAWTSLGVPLVGGSFPLVTLIGFCVFGGTMFGLIVFGAIVPAIINKRAAKKIERDPSAREITAKVVETNMISATTIGIGNVTEKFEVIIDTQFGRSKCYYKIKNRGGADTASENKRIKVGDEITVLINPAKPKICKIAEQNREF